MLLTNSICYFVIHFIVKFGTIGRLYYMMFDSAVFVIIVSRLFAAYNGMISELSIDNEAPTVHDKHLNSAKL
jgi:hypothetical protein